MNINLNERYKRFSEILMGKQLTDKFLDTFEHKNIDCNYSNIYIENERFWIVNVTRNMLIDSPYSFVNEKINGYSNSYSLYLNKFKDMIALKTSIVCDKDINLKNNMRRYFTYRINQLGFSTYDFINETNFIKYKTFETNFIKILIPQNKTEEDFVKLINFIDKFNEVVFNGCLKDWDSLKSISEKIHHKM